MNSRSNRMKPCHVFAFSWAGVSKSLVLLLFFAACTQRPNEENVGWESLFDGHDPSLHWVAKGGETFPMAGWVVEGDVLKILPGNEGGDIVSREQFADFELVVEFKLTDSANTGIKYFVSPLENEKGDTVLNGPEYQLIDDYNHESVKGGISPETSTASVYLLYGPEEKELYEAGRWNEARIVATDGHVEHWLNGKKVLDYHRGSPDFRARVANTKFSEYRTPFGESAYGYILLQDHNDEAHFRNIRIRRFE